MGIHINLAAILRDAVRGHGFRGCVGTLGEQAVAFDQEALHRLMQARRSAASGAAPSSPLRAADLFRAFGFDATESVDVSDYEGATHKFDLNEAELPDHLIARFDFVLNGGTLEHVFHVPNALANVTRMLRDGGVVLHVLPCNNWVDHGFYQFSPTLMFDYYAAAGFQLLESALVSYMPDDDGRWYIQPAPPGILGSGLAGTLDAKTYLHVFMARRVGPVIERPVPVQRLYARNDEGTARMRTWFSAYVLEHGEKQELAPVARIELKGGFAHCEGYCWRAEIPQLSPHADSLDQPVRSPLVLLEDGQPLGPPHALHDTIRARGRGAYSHWGTVLYFSTSDNSAPDRNGRRYAAVLPGQPEGRT